MMNFIRKWLRGNVNNAEKINIKAEEARVLKKQMASESLHKKKKLDTINLKTYRKLKKISDDLADITYAIAISTGANERGL